MSRIDKLSITGVRSFSPSVREAIEFNTPLTLIVGYNGSGKTTIIECLKYATTGEMPPNSKGGAFIHDPKLCGEKEVMAQVKLQFRSINNRQHVVTRSLQLTVKKTTRSQKTLEFSLAVVNNGERATTSTRQAQLDELIPERLGVSPAILDAVIFCHQDESLWPLSEPAALKKRFDEIFEVLKYTKVIDNLKVLRKKQVEQLGKFQTEEAHNKMSKDCGERAEKRMTLLHAEIEGGREQCEALTVEMQETKERIKKKHERANSSLQTVQNLRNKREQLEFRQDAITELKSTIDELPGTDVALQDSLAQYDHRMAQFRDESERNKVQYNELQRELVQQRSHLATKLTEQGKHQSEKEKHERQLRSRMETIQEAARFHSFYGYDGQLTEIRVKSFNEKMQKLVDERKRDLNRLQRDNSTELDEAAGAISDLEGRKAARTQDLVSAKQRLGAIDKRIAVLKNEMARIDIDEGAKADLESQHEDVEVQLLRARQELEKSGWDQQLSDDNEKLRHLESESENLGRELVECTRLASERAQLDYRKKELADRRRKFETLINTWTSKLASVLGQDWQPQTVEEIFQSAQTQQVKALEDARNKRNRAREGQQKVDFRLRSAKESLDKKTNEMARYKREVSAALRSVGDKAAMDDYLEEVESVEQQVEELRNELSLFDALLDYYTKCKRTLESMKKCQLCERHFDDGQKSSAERLSNKIRKYLDPKGKEDTERELKEMTASLESLRAVRASFDNSSRLSREIRELGEQCQSIEEEHRNLERQVDGLECQVSEEEEKLRDLEELSRTVTSIGQTNKDMKESEAQVDRIMSQQSSGGVSRSADEIQELQAGLTEQKRGLKAQISKHTMDRQRMRDLGNSLELERSELNNKISRVAGQLEKKKNLQDQIQSLREEQGHQREAMQKTDEELESLEASISEARSVRDERLRRGRAKEQLAADERDVVCKQMSEIKMLDNDIQDYMERGGASNLASTQRAIAALEQSTSKTEKEMAEVTVRTNQLKQEIDNSDQSRKNISDNINYRRHLGMLEVLRGEIAELEERNAHDDYERLQGEVRSLENQSNRLLAERGSVMGAMKTKDEELSRLLQEWELDYKNAKHKYRESHIRVETTKAAIEDLAQCGAAVDKAVMQFHALKMAEVNRIAGELWQSTYQGTDIDTILIRSDNESSTGKRSYNYRLCMVKQDTEMDMRGRCSAGQKVLASIIVRLALAESFGVNCGLIALDEPTTNLDRDNIKSLAESLHMIIRARQAQSNFQLIVITHDEDFLRHMRCSDFCDSFLRVKRDERQNSVIVRESITKIF